MNVKVTITREEVISIVRDCLETRGQQVPSEVHIVYSGYGDRIFEEIEFREKVKI